MVRLTRWLIDHRKTVVALLLLVTAVAGYGLSGMFIGTSWARMFFGDDPRYAAYERRTEQFGSDQIVSVAYEADRPLSPDAVARLARAVEQLRTDANVDRVISLLDAVRVVPGAGTRRYADLARDPAREAELTRELADHPLYGGLLIAADGKAAAVHVALRVDADRALEKVPALLDHISSALTDAGFPRESLHSVGFPVIGGELIRQTMLNLTRLLPLCILVLLTSLALLLRQLTPALVATFVGGLASVWTIGLAAFIDPRLSIMSSLVPAMVMIVAFADVIHLWSAYQLELRAGLSQREAILASGGEVGGACLLTSATTFVGFASISLAPAPVLRMLGLLLGVGVGLALVLAVIIVPLVLSVLPPPPPPDEERRGLGWRLEQALDGLLVGMAGLSMRHPRTVVALSVVVIAVAGWGASGLSFETDLGARFAADSTYRRDLEVFQRRFGGGTTAEVYVELADDARLDDPALYTGLAAWQADMLRLPHVQRATSLADVLGAARAAMSADPGPLTGPQATLLLTLLRSSKDGPASAFLSPDGRTLRLALRLDTGGVRAVSRLAAEIERLGQQHLGARVRAIEVTGIAPLLGGILDEIISGQTDGLLASMVGVTIMMGLALRTFSPALVAMVPNLLPLLLLAGYIGFAYGEIDSDAIIVFTAGIGIAVDDTLHVLLRLKLERQRCADPQEALVRTYRYAGRAIAVTTAILGLGFLPFAWSDYFTIRIMGTMLPSILVAALVADLLLLPALVTLGWLRLPGPEDRPAAPPEPPSV